jgi:hypothetical protein
MAFNLILGTGLALKSQQQASASLQSFVAGGFMDPTTEYLSDYVCKLTYEDLSREAVHQVKRTLIDKLGVRGGRVRQRTGVHRATHGVSSAGESSGAHPLYNAGNVHGYGGLYEYVFCSLPRL